MTSLSFIIIKNGLLLFFVALKKRNSNIKKFDEEFIIMVKEKDVKNLTTIDHQSFNE